VSRNLDNWSLVILVFVTKMCEPIMDASKSLLASDGWENTNPVQPAQFSVIIMCIR
jgi:hypothetical protein